MFKSKSRRKIGLGEDNAGLIGVGTLIVFISIVIVSTVAAGVLINTSLSLQQQARATTGETVAQISSGIAVIDAKGKTDSTQEIENIEIAVRPYPGTESINFENTVIQYKGEAGVRYLNYENHESGTFEKANNYYTESVQDTSATGATEMRNMGDVRKIIIQLPEDEQLKTNQTARLTFIPNSGFETYYEVMTPAAIGANRWYLL